MDLRQVLDSEFEARGAELDPIEWPRESLADLEAAIARVGERYVADLRELSQQFGRYYGAQLAAKDEELADLSRRLRTIERERDDLQSQVRQLRLANVRYSADLRAFAEQISRHLDGAESGAAE